MKFIQKLGYYLGGVSIGIVILMFFLGGKKASCDYGPNARTVKHLAGLKKEYSQDAKKVMSIKELDSTIVKNIIRYGNVDFSESETRTEPCKSYVIDNTYKEQPVKITLKKCDSLVTILTIKL
ncbi:hypothetical protein RM697_08955 [Ichthyenterobacterium sp. W332]|uniref:DUF4258 domain-containing protein n=1 Tax=Microcosmobacter mediterraneus TaxID=3075607 RepID=A0ABU2YND4_9FLAO|nr:hypothetical protein [Ichthyenterobacterium sp. W332]MDT0558775.1 hypothetical protein [Ichthyenterobacterium sp. W332]